MARKPSSSSSRASRSCGSLSSIGHPSTTSSRMRSRLSIRLRSSGCPSHATRIACIRGRHNRQESKCNPCLSPPSLPCRASCRRMLLRGPSTMDRAAAWRGHLWSPKSIAQHVLESFESAWRGSRAAVLEEHPGVAESLSSSGHPSTTSSSHAKPPFDQTLESSGCPSHTTRICAHQGPA